MKLICCKHLLAAALMAFAGLASVAHAAVEPVRYIGLPMSLIPTRHLPETVSHPALRQILSAPMTIRSIGLRKTHLTALCISVISITALILRVREPCP